MLKNVANVVIKQKETIINNQLNDKHAVHAPMFDTIRKTE
jgi:hypothetical protein